MKHLLTLTLIAFAITAKAQNKPKEYAKPIPNKAYTFTIKANQLDSLIALMNTGAQSLMDSQLPAINVKKLQISSGEISNMLGSQLREQIVADSLANVKKGGKP